MKRPLVIACAVLSAALLVMSTVSCSRKPRSRITQIGNNGRGIQVCITQAASNAAAGEHTPWPPSPSIRTSTDYFRTMRHSVFCDVGSEFFSAPGLLVATSYTAFSADHNAWSLNPSATATSCPPIPMVFTRNLKFRCDKEFAQAYITRELFNGKRGAVVVMSDGQMRMINEPLVKSVFDGLLSSHVRHILEP